MKLTYRSPPVRRIVASQKRKYERALYEAAQRGTHEASIGAQRKVRGKIKAVGLGGLANAVGQTSSSKKRQKPKTPYGTIYVRGGDESRAGQALKAYTKGATITARRKQWLAFATNAVPKRVGRYKITPERYNRGGLQTRIGQLQFVKVNERLAFLVVRNVTLHPRTHQAKRAGKGRPRTRVPAKQVIAFVLIKVTRRAVRFNKDREVNKAARELPDRIQFHLERLLSQ